METPKINIADVLRNWFLTPNDLHAEHLLVHVDKFNLMLKFRFGNRLINEATAEADQLRMIGAEREARQVEEDIFIARVNLNKVKNAMNLGMN